MKHVLHLYSLSKERTYVTRGNDLIAIEKVSC